MVYPGATNTRFHHAIGALYLMKRAIRNLRAKGVDISNEEEQGVSIAILLHDIGHGPFSHALEGKILPLHHEEVSLEIMKMLNAEYNNNLELAIAIFKNEYEKKYLHQLVSSQLDMDRMDYLIRDTYYTGVAEGVIGYDRIIKMLNVVDNELVVEEKGIYSIEKFLIARRLMYWQVYLHKTSLAAEHMLIKAYERVRALYHDGKHVNLSDPIRKLFDQNHGDQDVMKAKGCIDEFLKCDDIDILYLIKANNSHEDYFLSYICQCLLNRDLFKVRISESPFEEKYIQEQTFKIGKHLGITDGLASELLFTSEQKNIAYDAHKDEINILKKDGAVVPLSEVSNMNFNYGTIRKYYLYAPVF